MPFRVIDQHSDSQNSWLVIRERCDLENPDDPLFLACVDLFRDAYGEGRILSLAVDAGVERTFDLAAIRRAVRSGLPDPDEEGGKPEQLTNYRSETTEVLARGALRETSHVRFPASPQFGKSNANQPILGFDGWGLLNKDGRCWLVLIQVKGTDVEKIPPPEAERLKEECSRIPDDSNKIIRALSQLAIFLDGSTDLLPVLEMLEKMGNDELPPLTVAPVVVRGITEASLGDLAPIRDDPPTQPDVRALGVAISIGAGLTEFGRKVTAGARGP